MRVDAGRSAFTLVELLVVMGIIIVLIGLIFPSLGAVWKGSVRSRMHADLMAIGTALDAYKQDWGSYPGVFAADRGSAVLTAALIGPADETRDGHRGPGWRSRAGAKVQQPYLQAERFKLVDPANPRLPNPDLNVAVIGDRYSNPILYYPANPAANIAAAEGYAFAVLHTATIRPKFNENDNVARLPAGHLRRLLGDKNGDGAISGAGESAEYTGPFLLWSAGPDEQYGFTTPPPLRPPAPNNRCDDVANFQRTEY
jgi:type II secretory pathway pseudopilin PulG